MKKFFVTLLSAAMLFSLTVQAQVRECATMEVFEQQLKNDPDMLNRMRTIEQQTTQYEQSGNKTSAVITIPVVVHVVYQTATQNVSDAQIASQLTVLNADFRKMNADASLVPSAFSGLAADAEIQFCMAQRDPSGNATTGINRVYVNKASWGTNDAVKKPASGGVAPWDATKYLNLWVCNISGTNLSILGYAQFPGGSVTTDGVVIDYRCFGTTGTAVAPFNKGRTATHEVGHWLNLRHIWGDAACGDDFVGDTPTQNTSNYGCPAFPHVTCSNGANGDMFMNYMDYTDDACMYMFSFGQKTRMQALFAAGGARVGLATSNGCSAPTGGGTCAAPASQSAGSITTTGATISWAAVSGATSYSLRYKTTAGTTFTTVTATTTSYALTGLTAGTSYDYQVAATCGSTAGTYTALASFSTTATGGTCTDNYESNNTRTAAKPIAVNTAITAKIGTSTDKDYFSFANTTAQKNIRVDLTNLPADYDLKLYRGSTLLFTSQNSGTTAEQVIVNNGTVATYYAYVYGYNSAFNANSCYTLTANISASTFRMSEEENTIVIDASGLLVFPNPANNAATLSVPFENDGNAEVTLTDLNGRTVLRQVSALSKEAAEIQLDLSSMADGLYLVQVMTQEGVFTSKLTVRH